MKLCFWKKDKKEEKKELYYRNCYDFYVTSKDGLVLFIGEVFSKDFADFVSEQNLTHNQYKLLQDYCHRVITKRYNNVMGLPAIPPKPLPPQNRLIKES